MLTSALWRAVLWMAGALLSFLAMAVAGRELASELTLFQVVFVRNLVCLALLAPFCVHTGFRAIATRRPLRHVARNSVHYCAQYAWFYGLVSIPIAQVFAIEFTMPIWTALLACVFLGERMTRYRLAAVLVGFAGVLVIVQPGVQAVEPAALAVLGAAFGYASTYVITKSMIGSERPLTILLWMNLVQAGIGAVPALAAWTTPSSAMLPWLLLVGIGGLASHYCLSRALAHADATVVVPLDFLRLPLGAVVAWWLYDEGLAWAVLVGGVLILVANWLNLRRETPV